MAAQPPQNTGNNRSETPNPSTPNPRDPNLAPDTTASRMTDIVSEDGDAATQMDSAGDGRQDVQTIGKPAGMTGPVGEVGLPPSRPSTAATGHSSREVWSNAASPRRGLLPSVAGSTGATSTTSTRLPTSQSRTHVPSLTAQAFFRPMSSQRLQAQRSQRPSSLQGQSSVSGVDGQTDRGSTLNRTSQISGQNIRGPAQVLGLQKDANARPMSRGTDVTDLPGHETGNNSPIGAETVRSQGESVAPLQGQPTSRPNPARLDSNKPTNIQPSQKSPRSFRSSFILPNRNSRGPNSRTSITPRHQGHEKLGSTASTPKLAPHDGSKTKAKKDSAKNYEYFTGNIVFCWGGRMQNTKDKPISLFTAIATIIPGPLFLAQS